MFSFVSSIWLFSCWHHHDVKSSLSQGFASTGLVAGHRNVVQRPGPCLPRRTRRPPHRVSNVNDQAATFRDIEHAIW